MQVINRMADRLLGTGDADGCSRRQHHYRRHLVPG